MKVIVWTTYPSADASTRFRIMQFIPELEKQGFNISVSFLFSNYFYRIKNKTGFWKILILFLMGFFLLKRFLLLPISRNYDINIIHREAFPFFTPFAEKILRRFSRYLIFDFDDAIFQSPEKWKNWRDYLRDPSKINKVIGMSDMIWAGSHYLKNHALKFNSNVVFLPTVYNKTRFSRKKPGNKLVIGWIGSWTTLVNLEIVKPALEKLSEECSFVFRIIGGKNIRTFKSKKFEIEYIDWNEDSEVTDLADFDIGIMPLFDTDWERGKCGFKLIQYMTLGICAVASPVGANLDIISNGETGFFSEDKDWYSILKKLVNNAELRDQVGKNGQHFASLNYSFNLNIQTMAGLLYDSKKS